jgi:hypothetical protein
MSIFGGETFSTLRVLLSLSFQGQSTFSASHVYLRFLVSTRWTIGRSKYCRRIRIHGKPTTNTRKADEAAEREAIEELLNTPTLSEYVEVSRRCNAGQITIAPPVVDFETDNQGAGTTCP